MIWDISLVSSLNGSVHQILFLVNNALLNTIPCSKLILVVVAGSSTGFGELSTVQSVHYRAVECSEVQ